jgi:hypothetical protein
MEQLRSSKADSNPAVQLFMEPDVSIKTGLEGP